MSLASSRKSLAAIALSGTVVFFSCGMPAAFAVDPTAPAVTETAEASAPAETAPDQTVAPTPAVEAPAPAPADSAPAPAPAVEPPAPAPAPVPAVPAPAPGQVQDTAPTEDVSAPAAEAPAPAAPAPAAVAPAQAVQEVAPAALREVIVGQMIPSTTENGVYEKPFSPDIEYVDSSGVPLDWTVTVPEGTRLYVKAVAKDPTKVTLLGDTEWNLTYFVAGEPRPAFPNVAFSFSWINNSAGKGQVTVVNTEAHAVMAASVAVRIGTADGASWRNCVTPDGTVIDRLAGFYPIGETNCVFDGLKNGDVIFVFSQAETESLLFTVDGVAATLVEPAEVTSDGISVTVPKPTGPYVYRSDISGEIVEPGTYPLPLIGRYSVTAHSLSSDTLLTGTIQWTFRYTPRNAAAPQAPSFDDKKDDKKSTVTVWGAEHWTVTINDQPVVVEAGKSVTLPAGPYITEFGHDGWVKVVYTADAGYVDLQQGSQSRFEYSFRYTAPGQEPPAKEDNTKTKKVGICHATGLDGKFVLIPYVSVESIIEERGHAQHQDAADKIPAFDYIKQGEELSFEGQNWDQEFFDNGCKTVTEDPEPQPNPGDDDGDDHGGEQPSGPGTDSGNQPGNPNQPVGSGNTSGSNDDVDHQSASVVESIDQSQEAQGAAENLPWYDLETAARGGSTQSSPLAWLGAAVGTLFAAIAGFVVMRRREATEK